MAAPRIEIVATDITVLRVDAVVNAANMTLLGGGGVDGAIHRAAGPGLLAECRALGGCRTGDAKITGGHRLPCAYVVHAVGPVWRDGSQNEAELLASCYGRALTLAAEHGVKTIAFPAISCGAYRFPAGQAARIAVAETLQFLRSASSIETVFFVCFEPHIRAAYEAALRERSPA